MNHASIVRFIVLPILLALHHFIEEAGFVDEHTRVAFFKSRVITHVPWLLILPRLHLLFQLNQFYTTYVELWQDIKVLLLDILSEIFLFLYMLITIV